MSADAFVDGNAYLMMVYEWVILPPSATMSFFAWSMTESGVFLSSKYTIADFVAKTPGTMARAAERRAKARIVSYVLWTEVRGDLSDLSINVAVREFVDDFFVRYGMMDRCRSSGVMGPVLIYGLTSNFKFVKVRGREGRRVA